MRQSSTWGRLAGRQRVRPANRPGAAHLAFLVDDLESFVDRMLSHGATQLGQIAHCDGGHADGCDAVYMQDPNGVIVELVEDAPVR